MLSFPKSPNFKTLGQGAHEKVPSYDDDGDDYDDEKKRKQLTVLGTKSDHTLQLYDMNRGFPLCDTQFFYML